MESILRAIRRYYFGFFKKESFKNLKKYYNRGGYDVPFLVLLVILLATGLVLMFSASYVNALYNAGDVNTHGDPYYYFKKQLVFVIIGLVAMFLISRIKMEFFEGLTNPYFVLCIILLLLVFAFPAKTGKENFYRWLDLPGLPSFQPSEFAKVGVIMYCAWSLTKRKDLIEREWWGVMPTLMAVAFVCCLILLENHLSCTFIMFSLGIMMTYLGGAKNKMYILCISGVAVLVFFVVESGLLKDYAADRIDIWKKLITGQELSNDEVLNNGWQITQSLYAIGSGGLFGLGFGNSKQKHLYLPEPQNDFIFAIVCEELGYIRAIIIMIIFILFVARGFQIALRSKNRYGALVAMGVCFQIGLEAALNMAVVTATVPNTGISLPFFSYGGTAMVSLLAEVGLVLSVSRETTKPMKG